MIHTRHLNASEPLVILGSICGSCKLLLVAFLDVHGFVLVKLSLLVSNLSSGSHCFSPFLLSIIFGICVSPFWYFSKNTFVSKCGFFFLNTALKNNNFFLIMLFLNHFFSLMLSCQKSLTPLLKRKNTQEKRRRKIKLS